MTDADGTPIAQVRNLGPTSASWLRDIGIETYGDLERVGSVNAFLEVRHRRQGVSVVLLWALEAALRDVHGTHVDDDTKASLRAEAELSGRRASPDGDERRRTPPESDPL